MKNTNSEQEVQQSLDTAISRQSPKAKEDDDFQTPGLEDLYAEYTRYDDTLSIDTTYTLGVKHINVQFRHYCLRDSSLLIPDVYTQIYGITGFISHTYESALKVSVNGEPAIDTVIKRDVFNNSVSPELSRYGVLLIGQPSFDRDTFRVTYSLSIPLTDVGVSVEFTDHL